MNNESFVSAPRTDGTAMPRSGTQQRQQGALDLPVASSVSASSSKISPLPTSNTKKRPQPTSSATAASSTTSRRRIDLSQIASQQQQIQLQQQQQPFPSTFHPGSPHHIRRASNPTSPLEQPSPSHALTSICIASRPSHFSATTWWMVDLESYRQGHVTQGATPLVARCMPLYQWTETHARQVLRGYKQFLQLVVDAGDFSASQLCPPLDVESMHTQHILDVINYCHDSMLLCGQVVGHVHPPTASSNEKVDEKYQAEQRQMWTLQHLENRYGSDGYDKHIWNWEAGHQPEEEIIAAVPRQNDQKLDPADLKSKDCHDNNQISVSSEDQSLPSTNHPVILVKVVYEPLKYVYFRVRRLTDLSKIFEVVPFATWGIDNPDKYQFVLSKDPQKLPLDLTLNLSDLKLENNDRIMLVPKIDKTEHSSECRPAAHNATALDANQREQEKNVASPAIQPADTEDEKETKPPTSGTDAATSHDTNTIDDTTTGHDNLSQGTCTAPTPANTTTFSEKEAVTDTVTKVRKNGDNGSTANLRAQNKGSDVEPTSLAPTVAEQSATTPRRRALRDPRKRNSDFRYKP